MVKKKPSAKGKIKAKPLPRPPGNLTAAGYRYIAAVLEELREEFRPVLEGSEKLREIADNINNDIIQWRKERERLDEILSHPATRKKFLEEYKLRGTVCIFDFPVHEKENIT